MDIEPRHPHRHSDRAKHRVSAIVHIPDAGRWAGDRPGRRAGPDPRVHHSGVPRQCRVVAADHGCRGDGRRSPAARGRGRRLPGRRRAGGGPRAAPGLRPPAHRRPPPPGGPHGLRHPGPEPVRVGGPPALRQLPASVGRLIGCDPDLVALTDSATRAWNLFVTALPWQSGDRVLICGTEYASNAIALLRQARLSGCSVEVVPNGADGRVDVDALAAMLDDRVRLVSLVHVPTNSGQVAPVREVVARAHAVGALVLLDACQSVGQLRVHVAELGVDALAATGRKWLRAPRGTGFLYVRRTVLDGLEPAAPDMRGGTWTAADDYTLAPGARRFELWEHDVAGRLGLKAAVDHLLALGADEVEQVVRSRAADLRAALAGLPGVRIRDVGGDLSGIVSFTVDGVAAGRVRDRLAERDVTVTVSEAPSTLIDMTARGL